LNNRILMSPGHERGFGYLANAAIGLPIVSAPLSTEPAGTESNVY
jgi:hypothetical protein